MKEVYVYIINGEIHVESPEREMLHIMTGFKDTNFAYIMIENLKNMYEVVEIFS